MDPDAVNISRFKSYHHYLDSLIAEEDIRYLQDGELARLIGLILILILSLIGHRSHSHSLNLISHFSAAELGYRGAGRTLTEKEYLEEVDRIEQVNII